MASSSRCASCTSFILNGDLGSKSLVLNTKSGDVICIECGAVKVSKVLENGAEWRSFTDDTKHLGAVRASADGMVSGISQIENVKNVAQDPKENKVLRNLHLVKEIGSMANLSQGIQKLGKDIFSQSILLNVEYSRNEMVLAGAALYIACKLQGFPRTLDEISSAADIDKFALGKVSSNICKCLQLPVSLTHPIDLISRFIFISDVDAAPRIILDCEYACEKITSLSLFEGTSPQIIAAAVILFIAIVRENKLFVNNLLTVSACKLVSIQKVYTILRSISHSILREDALKGKVSSVDSPLPLHIDQALLNKLNKNDNKRGNSEICSEEKHSENLKKSKSIVYLNMADSPS
jgi:transcription initiation factor TFIIB